MEDLTLPPLPDYRPAPGPVVLCILDGVGIGRGDEGDAVHVADTPTLDRLRAGAPSMAVAAHGRAVGLPSDDDMGNSEVGHNALGAGRVFDQGAALVNQAFESGRAFEGEVWRWLTGSDTLHLLGLFSDGNVHSHVNHLYTLIRRAARDGVRRLRVHLLTDGRDVDARSALTWLAPLEALLAEQRGAGLDYRVAGGGGRMRITMDRYEADWEMVKRGWDCHVHGVGRPFASAREAIEALYAEDPKVNDQWLPAFVIVENGEPVGRIADGDAVLFTNFRGDRALEISRAFEGREVPFDRGDAPSVRYAGMMQYDGDLLIPARYLVAPPEIDRTMGEHLAANGKRTFAISETQKFGHVTYFFNGNRSGYLDESLERYVEIKSDNVPFEQAPAMKAAEITDAAVAAIASGQYDHVRLNLANGDMVGHTGDFAATVSAMETVDACVARLEAAVRAADGVMIVTADHGNADQMYEIDKKSGAYKDAPRTSHTLNPVPFLLVDPGRRWALAEVERPGLANIGTSVLALCGLTPPEDFEPALVRPA